MKEAMNHADGMSGDIEDLLAFYYTLNTTNMPGGLVPKLIQNSNRLLKVSPDSPPGLAVLIQYDWPSVEKRVAEWGDISEQYPLLIDALTNHYIQAKEYENARQCLKQYIAISPDKKHYEGLAEFYKYRGEMDNWLQTLEDFLKHEDSGLADDSVRVEIANYYMGQKQWRKALPYAEESAKSGANWAMTCASQCNEGLQDWEKSEQWMKKTSERYDECRLYWYIWCKRTEHGDIEAARQFFIEGFNKPAARQKIDDLGSAGIFYLLENQPDKALQFFQEAFNKTFNPYYGFHAFIIAHLLNEQEIRNEILKIISEKSGRSRKYIPLQITMPLVSLFKQLIDSKTQDPMFLNAMVKAFDEVIALAPAGTNTDLVYFVGRFLEHNGLKDEGIEYIKRAASSTDYYQFNRALACNFLQSRGIKID